MFCAKVLSVCVTVVVVLIFDLVSESYLAAVKMYVMQRYATIRQMELFDFRISLVPGSPGYCRCRHYQLSFISLHFREL